MRIAKRPLLLTVSGVAVLSVVLATVVSFHATGAHAAAITSETVPLTRVGSASFASAGQATDFSTQTDEIDQTVLGGDADSAIGGPGDEGGINRSIPGTTTGNGRVISSSARPKSNPVLGTNFQGLNLFNQRFANNGNQFSVEPPDQGLCAGNGFVIESVNDVLRIYHSDGTPATGVIDLNTFYNYPAAIVRSGPNRGQEGPEVTDPSCVYDQAIGRFVHVILTLDRVSLTNPALTGVNHLDIAVSDTGDPTGSWSIFKLPVQNDGTQGTPNHHCFFTTNKGVQVFDPCLGDYPKVGFDANGIYLTTNEFTFFGSGFFGAQVYAIGTSVLTSGSGGTVGNAVLFNTVGAGPDGAGHTVWPAITPGNQFDVTNGGTEYFLSSDAVFSQTHQSTRILQWTMSNTSSLNSASPSVSLDITPIAVDQYAVPPRAQQPAGNHPLSDCLADTTFNCALLIAGRTSHDNSNFGNLNANDSRMQEVFYANGKLWGALDTAVNVGGQNRAGIAYYVVNPHANKIVLQGQAGVAGTDLTYPAVGVLDNGRGVIAFTLTGDSNYPSAAFASLDAVVGLGDIDIAAAGAGAWDGFTGYVQFGAGRPRWGDYGYTAVDGQTIWMASEYVNQTCDYATYKVDPTCGGTRAPLGNWSTYVSNVTP